MRKFWNHMQVGNRLIVVYLLTGFLPICLVCGTFFMQMKKILQEREMYNLDNTFQQAVTEVDNELELYVRMSDYIVFNQTVSVIVNNFDKNNYDDYRRLVKEFNPMMDSLRYFYPEISQITIYVNNDSVSHGNYICPYSEIEGESWAQLDVEGLQWHMDRDNGKIMLIREMLFLEGVGGGILFISLDYNQMLQRLQLMDENVFSVFVYEDDTLLYEYEAGEEQQKIGFTAYQKIRSTDNHKYLMLEQTLEQAGWKIGCIMPKGQITRPLRHLTMQVFVIWAVCIVLSLILIFCFAKQFSGRITRLNNSMKEVEAGNLDIVVQDGQMDEIGNLTVGFNRMVAELRRLIKEVYAGQIAQKKYEMTALRAQINPHFLYNSLSLINWKALEIDAQDISKITLALSRYYRTSLNKGKNIMPIREELDNVKAYLEIQEMFHDFSFDVEIDVDPEILEYETLNLVLQPLVENAIHHGIDRMRSGRGKIVIEGGLEGDLILLKVRDNGIGMSQEKAEVILGSKSSGYGVKNVNSRIHLQYGDAYGLTVISEEGRGTEIQVCFPCRKFVKEQPSE